VSERSPSSSPLLLLLDTTIHELWMRRVRSGGLWVCLLPLLVVVVVALLLSWTQLPGSVRDTVGRSTPAGLTRHRGDGSRAPWSGASTGERGTGPGSRRSNDEGVVDPDSADACRECVPPEASPPSRAAADALLLPSLLPLSESGGRAPDCSGCWSGSGSNAWASTHTRLLSRVANGDMPCVSTARGEGAGDWVHMPAATSGVRHAALTASDSSTECGATAAAAAVVTAPGVRCEKKVNAWREWSRTASFVSCACGPESADEEEEEEVVASHASTCNSGTGDPGGDARSVEKVAWLLFSAGAGSASVAIRADRCTLCSVVVGGGGGGSGPDTNAAAAFLDALPDLAQHDARQHSIRGSLHRLSLSLSLSLFSASARSAGPSDSAPPKKRRRILLLSLHAPRDSARHTTCLPPRGSRRRRSYMGLVASVGKHVSGGNFE